MRNLEIIQNGEIGSLTTLRAPARADYLLLIDEAEDLEAVRGLGFAVYGGQKPYYILGGGSNVLFCDHFHGSILHIDIQGVKVVNQNDDFVWIEVGAGVTWHKLVKYCVAQGWGGLENLAMIPGTVGAAPVQNIGAYGVELAETLAKVSVFDLDSGGWAMIEAKHCGLGYRDSAFKHKWRDRFVITEVLLRLRRKPCLMLDYGPLRAEVEAHATAPYTSQDVFDAVCRIRRSKLPDPKVLPNAGSFFKNPLVTAEVAAALSALYPKMPQYPQADGRVKLAAGWLIEQCGWKGKRIGAVGAHDKQALVLVNYGGATGREILAVADVIANEVWMEFDVQLEREVQVVKGF